MKKEFAWNKKQVIRKSMWDTKNSEEYYIDEEVSIKDRLKNPNMKRASDVMAEMSIALGLIMDQLEEMSKEN